MKNKQVLQLLKVWVDQIGKQNAAVRLCTQGVSPRTAEMLISGRYANSPRVLLAKVLITEMAKDGILVAS